MLRRVDVYTVVEMRERGKPVLPLDASLYLPNENLDGDALFEKMRLPGAQRFNLDTWGNPFSGLPHMLPPVSVMEEALATWGWDGTQTPLVYDQRGMFSALRGAWTLSMFGLKPLTLKGGLPAWRAAGLSMDMRPHVAPKRAPKPRLKQPPAERLADLGQVLQGLRSGAAQVVDARSRPRFLGEAPEPRAELRPGHMPGALNLPFATLMDEKGWDLLPKSRLKHIFMEAGLDLEKPLIMSCGSGVTAAILVAAAEELGAQDVRLYDGSWAEWGQEKAMTPVVLG